MLLASSCVLVVVVVVVHPAINVNNAVAPIIMKKIRFTWFFLSRHLRFAITDLKEAKNLAGKNPPPDSD